jgi:hypothetical protein
LWFQVLMWVVFVVVWRGGEKGGKGWKKGVNWVR